MKLRSTSFALLLAVAVTTSCDRDEAPVEAEKEASTSNEAPQPGAFILAKLDSIIIPVIDFEDTSVEEAIDYLRVRSMELDKEGDPAMRGISMLIEKPRNQVDSPDGLNGWPIDGETTIPARIARYRAKNVSLLEALIETCKLAELDAYLTSHGIVICPRGTQPSLDWKGPGGEIWKKLTSP